MSTTCCFWTVLLSGILFTNGIWGLPASNVIDCTTPMPYTYPHINEGFTGKLELVETPPEARLKLEAASCPVCLSFLDLIHTPGDALATVQTKKPLDAEILAEHNGFFNYTVVCTNSGVKNNRSLGLNDINDNAPVFEKDVYEVQVLKSLAVGSLVVQVKATDADISPVFNSVNYSIEPPSDTFEVTRDGSVLLKKQLNFNITTLYSFNVTAMGLQHSPVEPSSLFAVETSSGQTDVVSKVRTGTVTLKVKATDIDGLYDTATVEVTIKAPDSVVQISINKPPDTVRDKVHEIEKALEKALGLQVTVVSVTDSSGNAVISFIAMDTSGNGIPPEEVNSVVEENKEELLEELKGLFGPDTELIGDGGGPSIIANIVGALVGVAVLGGIAIAVLFIFNKKRQQEPKRRGSQSSMKDMPVFSFWKLLNRRGSSNSMKDMLVFALPGERGEGYGQEMGQQSAPR